MTLKREELVVCEYCNQSHIIYEYSYLEGSWYSEHYCEKLRDLILCEPASSDTSSNPI